MASARQGWRVATYRSEDSPVPGTGLTAQSVVALHEFTNDRSLPKSRVQLRCQP
jgi:hypothetical protein